MAEPTWISVPEAAEILGVRDREVRQMLRDRRLVAVYSESGARGVAKEMLDLGTAPATVLEGLPGTLTLLADGGVSDEGVVRWLFEVEEELQARPIDALRDGRVHAVRRVALAQAF